MSAEPDPGPRAADPGDAAAPRPRSAGDARPSSWGALAREVGARLDAGRGARRAVPGWGRIVVDRSPRFLCVYRRPPRREEPEMETLVQGEAAYLTAPGVPRHAAGVAQLVRAVCAAAKERSGAFLLLELWAGRHDPDAAADDEAGGAAPAFKLVAPGDPALRSTVEAFERALARVRIAGRPARVTTEVRAAVHPPGRQPLLPAAELERLATYAIGVEVHPVFLDPRTGEPYPLVLRRLRRQLARAVKQGAFEFARRMTARTPAHYQALGPRALVKAVWQVDRQLADIGEAFDLLLAVTPVNRRRAWAEFRRGRYEKPPDFRYRPLTVEPELLKRRLFGIPIERVEDPALADLFRAEQREIDRKLSLLLDRGTPAFLQGSLQLHGAPDEALVREARSVMRRAGRRDPAHRGEERVRAEGFAARARRELAAYRERHAGMPGRVQVRDDVEGLIVSGETLLVGSGLDVTAARAEALLQHEVGTHLVTYANGREQPLELMHAGLPGYDELQEGLAVLGEHLVGGLDASRLRRLAARVIACDAVARGATFVDTYRLLTREHGFAGQRAFSVATRVHRGGGFVKDALYLRGLVRLLERVGDDWDAATLYAGKFGLKHLPLVRELRSRDVLRPAKVLPRFLDDPAARARLEALRSEKTRVTELLPSRNRGDR